MLNVKLSSKQAIITLLIFELFKINVKYNDFIIKRIYNNKNIVIKD